MGGGAIAAVPGTHSMVILYTERTPPLRNYLRENSLINFLYHSFVFLCCNLFPPCSICNCFSDRLKLVETYKLDDKKLLRPWAGRKTSVYQQKNAMTLMKIMRHAYITES